MSLQKLMEIHDKLPPEYQSRLKEELDVVVNNGIKDFMPYFITLKEFIDWCKEHNVLVGPARGSVGGTLIGYLLGLHALDPIKYKLPFKRFLSVSRLKKSTPDIDIDYPTGARDQLNNFLFDKYGDRCSFVATFSMLKLKNSLMDSWRINVTQPTEMQISQLKTQGKANDAALISHDLEKRSEEFNDIRKSLGKKPIGFTDQEWLLGCTKDDIFFPGLLETNEVFDKWTKRNPKVLETVQEIMGIPRSIGQHAAGVIICDQPIYEICPVLKIDGKNVAAYDKKTIPKLGLIKNDNLGLTCLNFIGDCLGLLKEKGISFDPWNLPDDPKVYSIFMDGTCRTIFQHDTMGGASFVKKLKPTCFDHIAYSVALNRPGALDAKVRVNDTLEISGADAFVLRKAGRLPVTYIHPDLEPLLKETLGIMVYQENTMQVLQALAGYSEEESDNIRSAISDKNPDAFSDVKQRLQNLTSKGWTKNQVDELFQQIVAWGSYGFNKSHAYGYAKLAYCTAYLKYYYPLEWWCSVLSNSTPDEIMEKFWPEVGKIISDTDINASKERFVIKDGKLVPPLKLISNLGETALKEISSKTPFTDLPDFMSKINARVVNKRVVENLIKSGCMDKLFDPSFSLKDKIGQYYQLKEKRESKKQDLTLFNALTDITPYGEYLLAKEVLPICNKSLSEAVKKSFNISKPFITLSHYTKEGKEFDMSTLRGSDFTLVNGDDFMSMIDVVDNSEEGYADVCVYGYVLAARKFAYRSKKHNAEKQALELTLDFDCNMIKTVCWPRKDDFVPKIAGLVEEKKAYLFKVRINKDPNWRFGIAGLEPIKEKRNDTP